MLTSDRSQWYLSLLLLLLLYSLSGGGGGGGDGGDGYRDTKGSTCVEREVG